MRYKIIKPMKLEFGLQTKIANRIGIGVATLNKIVNGKTTTTKSVAWYITYLHLRSKNEMCLDERLKEYFEIIK